MTTKHWQQEMKAEPLDTPALDAWLSGRRARRILVIPFTGPLPGGKAGLDLDGEFFDDETDLYGGYEALRRTRERVVDWHHDQLHGDPTGRMKGAILGHVVLDEQPQDDGLWADFWANAGERRRDLLARLERQGVPLYGSSEPVQAGVRVSKADGHIEVWPLIRHTITTTPQNTHAVVPALKALLDDAPSIEALTVDALVAAVVGEGPDGSLGTLGQVAPDPGNRPGKADGLTTEQETRMADLLARIKQAI